MALLTLLVILLVLRGCSSADGGGAGNGGGGQYGSSKGSASGDSSTSEAGPSKEKQGMPMSGRPQKSPSGMKQAGSAVSTGEDRAPKPPRAELVTVRPLNPAPAGPPDDPSNEFIGGGDGSGGQGNWDYAIQSLRRNGLEIVLTFDSTSSMGGEIDEVKRQIRRIGGALLKLVPKARISICTYRDHGDDYVVDGLPLTADIQAIDEFLAGIDANGGGDGPEAVQEGLRWAVTSNQFRKSARKVILLFGDAPPHVQDLDSCLNIASEFKRRQKGIVSAVSCHSSGDIPEFKQIAEAGGGETFVAGDERGIITELMILAFGSRHRQKVVEAFELLDK
jgi:hypothetical protein